VDDLKNLQGKEFDLAYMKAVRTDHEMLVGLFQGAAAHANDADVRQYASDTLPVLQAHLAKAQQLEIKRQ
jgi:putative membrane protein